jgi:hypothetical protein
MSEYIFEHRCYGVNGIQLAHNMEKCLVFVKVVTNISVA